MNMQGQVGELQMIIQVTRADTGIVEEHHLNGFLDADQLTALQNAEKFIITPLEEQPS